LAAKRPLVGKNQFEFGIESTRERSSKEEVMKLVAEWESNFGVEGKSNEEFRVIALKMHLTCTQPSYFG